MEYQMGSGQRLCGTCEYWVGQRSPNFYCSHVVLPDQYTLGRCMCMHSPCRRMEKASNTCACMNHEKWRVLK